MSGCVGKVLKILTAISAGNNKPVTIKSISETTGIPKSTCVRIVSEMVEEGYVDQVSRVDGYRLGPIAYWLSRYGNYDSEFISICHPVLRWLHKKTGLCVGLAKIQHGKVFIVDCLNTNPKTVTTPGSIYPDDIYFTPAGRIILANMTVGELQKIYDKYGNPVKGKRGDWHEVTSFETLREQISKINPKGVLKFIERPVEGKTDCWGGWGAAISKHGKCVGAIVISITTENGTMQSALEREEEIRRYMLEARNEINKRIRF